jgi:hypothetical protein
MWIFMRHRKLPLRDAARLALAPVLLAPLLLAAPAHADIVTPIATGSPLLAPFTSTASSTVTTPQTETGDGLDDGIGPVMVSDILNNAAGSYTFNRTISANTSSFGALNGQQYNFVDSYVIDIPTASASAFAFSLNLTDAVSMTNLSARLYSYSANGVTNLTVGGTGSVNGNASGWSAPTNGGTVDSTLLTTSFPTAGEYVLQIVGDENGTVSGTYNGTLTITPVPLPAALPLLLAGLGGLGLSGRRSRS